MHCIEPKRHSYACKLSILLAAVIVALTLAIANFNLSLVTAQQSSTGLTGNWRVQTQNADGTYRRSYFNLQQEGPRITGSIRVTQFYYLVKESTGGPDGFTLVATMKDEGNKAAGCKRVSLGACHRFRFDALPIPITEVQREWRVWGMEVKL